MQTIVCKRDTKDITFISRVTVNAIFGIFIILNHCYHCYHPQRTTKQDYNRIFFLSSLDQISSCLSLCYVNFFLIQKHNINSLWQLQCCTSPTLFVPPYHLLINLNTMHSNRHLISLWFPSICHNDNGCFTLYWRLLTVDFHLCTIPMGSILNNDRWILSRWTRQPLLSKKPLRTLIPIPGCSSHACLVSSSSWLSSMVLYVPSMIRQYQY